MDDIKYNKLEKEISYLNDEFVTGDEQVLLFRDADAAIEAIRNNQIPGIKWTEEDEAKYQTELQMEAAIKESSTLMPEVTEDDLWNTELNLDIESDV